MLSFHVFLSMGRKKIVNAKSSDQGSYCFFSKIGYDDSFMKWSTHLSIMSIKLTKFWGIVHLEINLLAILFYWDIYYICLYTMR